MNKIEQVFQNLKKENKKALIPYVSCGDPNLEFTEELIPVLEKNGADIIELGIPYSDPLADGPTIQRASSRALSSGMTLDKTFSLAAKLNSLVKAPLVLMTYYNPVFAVGIENFTAKAQASGVSGLIVPDLPLEEAGALQEAAEKKGLTLTFLIAPTSTPERIQKAAEASQGFIYCVSIAGVTGARKIISQHLEGFITQARRQTKLPLAVGFGISSPQTAKEAAAYADGIIVGSALINIIERNINNGKYDRALEEASYFTAELKKAVS